MFLDKLGGGRLYGNILAVLSGLAFSFLFVFMRMQKDGSPLESILMSHWLTAAIGIGASLFRPAPRITWGAVGAVAARAAKGASSACGEARGLQCKALPSH
jgi:hypothetical protein